ncbi:hypothetical protein KVT40_004346 [Elsinoe batatas]|uniref:Protein kinase domain-containing protein n=1 Tax=Elsinoe batatas TaxID=2601811 RepID=A0A8K0L5E3_9PEZI|nr:hypothetical protein KVT40_004346 [Elsinoe batatas]
MTREELDLAEKHQLDQSGISQDLQGAILRATRVPKLGVPELDGVTVAEAVRRTGGAIMFRKYGRTNKIRRSVRNEVEILRDLNHPNIVACFAGPKQDDPDPDTKGPVLEIECLNGVSLERLSEGSISIMPAKLVLILLRSISSVLVYLVEQEVEHNDIRIENIVVSPSGIKLIDFGTATKADARKVWRDGTSRYIALEVQDSREDVVYGARDVMAFGVVLFWAIRWIFAPTGDSFKVKKAIDPGKHRERMKKWCRKLERRSASLPSMLGELVRVYEEYPERRMLPHELGIAAAAVDELSIEWAFEAAPLVRACDESSEEEEISVSPSESDDSEDDDDDDDDDKGQEEVKMEVDEAEEREAKAGDGDS